MKNLKLAIFAAVLAGMMLCGGTARAARARQCFKSNNCSGPVLYDDVNAEQCAEFGGNSWYGQGHKGGAAKCWGESGMDNIRGGPVIQQQKQRGQ